MARKIRRKKNPILINTKKRRKYTSAELTSILIKRDGEIRQLREMLKYYQEWSKRGIDMPVSRLRQMIRRSLVNELWQFNSTYYGSNIYGYQMETYIHFRLRKKMIVFYQIRAGLWSRPKNTKETSQVRMKRSEIYG